MLACLLHTFTPSATANQKCSDHQQWVRIPAGFYISGSDRRERDYGYRIGSQAARKFRWFDNWEFARESRYEGSYYISRYPTTQDDYARFVAATGHRSPGIDESQYRQQGYLVHPYSSVVPYLWKKSKKGDAIHPDNLENHPVVLVSQADARAYCRWLGRQQGIAGRLPSEWQWEKAARGADGRYFPWGNVYDPDHLNASYQHRGTTPVDRFPAAASPYGVMDMAGNVFEWTISTFADNKVTLKGGGSWDDSPGITRAASRHGRLPGSRHILFGFRCVCLEQDDNSEP